LKSGIIHTADADIQDDFFAQLEDQILMKLDQQEMKDLTTL